MIIIRNFKYALLKKNTPENILSLTKISLNLQLNKNPLIDAKSR